MESRMVRTLVMMAAAVALVMAVALPADAGPAMVEKMTGFCTSALQGPNIDPPGDFQWVFCSQATRVVKPDGSAVETYKCELHGFDAGCLGMGPDVFDPVALPDSAMRFTNATGAFYFSDFRFLNDGLLCFADTWREQLTPSGNVLFKADYADGDDCLP